MAEIKTLRATAAEAQAQAQAQAQTPSTKGTETATSAFSLGTVHGETTSAAAFVFDLQRQGDGFGGQGKKSASSDATPSFQGFNQSSPAASKAPFEFGQACELQQQQQQRPVWRARRRPFTSTSARTASSSATAAIGQTSIERGQPLTDGDDSEVQCLSRRLASAVLAAKAAHRTAQEEAQLDADLRALLVDGDGTHEQKRQAEKIARTLAEQGQSYAQYLLGWFLQDGIGIAKDERQAVEWFRKAAEAGNAEAQLKLAFCLETGAGIGQDQQQALFWYRKAAEQGDAEAQFNLGMCLTVGDAIETDDKEAVALLFKAAEQGHVRAMSRLGSCLLMGTGIAKDEAQAVRWYSKAAAAGDATAQCNLGTYLRMTGTAKNEKQAVMWYSKAAHQGDAHAQYFLGFCLGLGIGVERNEKLALEWYLTAAENGQKDAQFNAAVCFRFGQGTAIDLKTAIHWFEKASAQGQEMATVHLTQLRSSQVPGFALSFDRAKTSLVRRELLHVIRSLSPSNFGQAVLCYWMRGFGDVVVKAPRDASVSQAWLNEWVALSALSKHKNVINLLALCADFECIDAEGQVLKPPISFVTPFFRNGSIVDFFGKPEHTGLAAKHLRPWALDIARGLAHLHKHKVVHRDLAARNVFIDDDEHGMYAVVGDLGLARELDAKGTYVSAKAGIEYKTPADMEPRAFHSKEFTTGVDIFSFGLTLFEIATECKDSDTLLVTWNTSSKDERQSFAHFRDAAAAGYPTLMSKLPGWVPEQMKRLMLRCLAVDDGARPSAEDIVNEIENEIERECVVSFD